MMKFMVLVIALALVPGRHAAVVIRDQINNCQGVSSPHFSFVGTELPQLPAIEPVGSIQLPETPVEPPQLPAIEPVGPIQVPETPAILLYAAPVVPKNRNQINNYQGVSAPHFPSVGRESPQLPGIDGPIQPPETPAILLYAAPVVHKNRNQINNYKGVSVPHFPTEPLQLPAIEPVGPIQVPETPAILLYGAPVVPKNRNHINNYQGVSAPHFPSIGRESPQLPGLDGPIQLPETPAILLYAAPVVHKNRNQINNYKGVSAPHLPTEPLQLPAIEPVGPIQLPETPVEPPQLPAIEPVGSIQLPETPAILLYAAPVVPKSKDQINNYQGASAPYFPTVGTEPLQLPAIEPVGPIQLPETPAILLYAAPGVPKTRDQNNN